ncbi:MAG: NAD(+)/NADH kinase [Anaerolineaceae bacterium]
MPGTVGLVVNPASGKDIRRLVAHASVFDNGEKRSIIRRAILGANAVGVERFVYLPDSHGIVESALEDLDVNAEFVALDSPQTGTALDTTRIASQMRDREIDTVIILGGDGTNRAFTLGWRDAPIVAVSTGTNNVFPQMVEGTVAGAAAGLVASGAILLKDASRQVKVVHVEIEDERDDLALIDAVLLDELFVGSKAVWDVRRLRTLVLSRAEPGVVGMSAIGGLICPVPESVDGGLWVEVGAGGANVLAPIAPGLYVPVVVRAARPLQLNQVVEVRGPGILALDGERERRLAPSQVARLSVRRDGPRVIDMALTLTLAACRGVFRTEGAAASGD